MPWDLLIHDGTIVTPDAARRADLAIENGVIVELADDLRGAARETIDARGLHVFPGVIDAHVHFNEPGRTEWEGFDTGSAALAAGGGTCFFEMPLNASPPTLDGASFDLKLAAARASSRTDFALWGGLTPINLDKMQQLAERGVIGFKAFMSNSGIDDFGRADDETLFRGMEIAAELNLPVAVHAEDEAMTSQLAAEAIRAGHSSYQHYLDCRPVEAEVAAIINAIAMARETGCALHIVHISSPAGVRAASVNDADATRETCPHYLSFTGDDLIAAGAPLKCAPPLRDRKSVDEMIALVRGGAIDIIGSDHSPAPASMKTSDDAFKVWGGIAGVQSTLAVLLSIDPPLELGRIAALLAKHVADRFALANKGQIKIGLDADLALVDLNARFMLTREMLLDRHKLSPYVGRNFRGAVKRTLVRGQTIFLNGQAIGPFRGRLVTPTR